MKKKWQVRKTHMVSRSHCKHHLASPEHRSHLRDLSDLWCQLDHFDVGRNVNIIISHYLYHRHHHHDHGPHCTWCQLGRAGSSQGRQQCQDPQSGLPLPWVQSSLVSQMLWIYVQRIDHKVVFFNLNIQIPGFPSECEKTGAESIRIGCFRLIFAVVKNVPGMVK